MSTHKKIAFVNSKAVHGGANARESLDAVLASSAFCEDISLFFLADGIYQLTSDQQPQASLQRHISPTFGMLELYDIENIYICQHSLQVRGVQTSQLFINEQVIGKDEIAKKLSQFDQVIHF